MYKILHIPSGNFVKTYKYITYTGHILQDISLTILPDDPFDRADILRKIIYIDIQNNANKCIRLSCCGTNPVFSEFAFVEVSDV